MNITKLQNALYAAGHYLYQCKSSYPDSDVQSNLSGRTHYADSDTLKYFKANILRGKHSKNGLYYILQESLPHPDYKARIRRNVVFDIFGSVVTESRETCHTNPEKADKHYKELATWCDTKEAEKLTLDTLKHRLIKDDVRIQRVRAILRGAQNA